MCPSATASCLALRCRMSRLAWRLMRSNHFWHWSLFLISWREVGPFGRSRLRPGVFDALSCAYANCNYVLTLRVCSQPHLSWRRCQALSSVPTQRRARQVSSTGVPGPLNSGSIALVGPDARSHFSPKKKYRESASRTFSSACA